MYRITARAGDSVAVDGRKVVSGEEVEMGVLACRADSGGGHITCLIPQGVWRFTVRHDSLVGELTLPDGTRSRDVRTARAR